MKTTILTLIAILLTAPALISAYEGFTGGMQVYEKIKVSSTTITKIYDHDEGVICYVKYDAISCVKDN